MRADTYEQETVDKVLFGEQAKLLADGMEVILELHEGQALSGEQPGRVQPSMSDELASRGCAARHPCASHSALHAADAGLKLLHGPLPALQADSRHATCSAQACRKLRLAPLPAGPAVLHVILQEEGPRRFCMLSRMPPTGHACACRPSAHTCDPQGGDS